MSIERASVPRIVADQIKGKIESGALVHNLPGQQKLADSHKVSVPSVIEALVLLEREGYLEPAERGKKRKITPLRAKQVAAVNLLVLSPPTRSLTASNLDMIEGAKRAWMEKYPSATCIHQRRMHRPMNLSDLKTEVSAHNIRAVLAFEATKDWVEALGNIQLPVYRFGGTGFTAKLGNSGLGHNIEEIITEGIEALTKHGHTRILTPLTRPYLTETTTKVYQSLLKSSGIDWQSFCPPFPIDNQTGIQAFWKKQLSTLQPTAVLSIHLPVLYSLIGFCNAAKLNIPENLSVVSLMNHDLIDFFEPKIVAPKNKHYERLAMFQKWLDSDFQEQGFSSLPLDLCDGGSITTISS